MPVTIAATMEIHRFMLEATERYGRDEFDAAASLCERVLELSAEFPEALHLLGLCRWKQQDLRAALDLLAQAQVSKPGDAQLWHHLGILRNESGDIAGAQTAFRRAAELNPRNTESHYNLGVTCETLGDAGGAEAEYRRTLALNNHHGGAAAGLATLCEARNQIDEAGRWLEIALRENPQDAVANLTRAQLDFRAGRYRETVVRLEAQLKRPLSPVNRSLTLGRLGMAYDHLGQTDDAFDAFMQAKNVLRESLGDVATDNNLYSLAVAACIQRMSAELVKNANALTDAAAAVSPVFLLGFPRSGTTLLDQILSTHSRIVVLEEKETLRDVLTDYAASDARLAQFAGADDVILRRYRERYWARVAEFMPERPRDRLFIDKLPLNTMLLPLIHRLFPASPIIFALRDPRDVVLSCFMQSFEPNAAMRHFFTLESTVEYYAAVMAVGRTALEALPGRIHRLRYEDLVEDTEAEARRLLAFLHLGWEPAVLDFHKTARQRRINTPSYHQVAQPIYSTSRERWRRYEKHLQSALPRLQSFVKFFGYA
ncbi:MAG: sulfotransferase [Gammaproteobacteria bacterium]